MKITSVSVESDLIDIISHTGDIVLYGAGRQGGLMKEWLDISGHRSKLKCFANTSVQNTYCFKGLPVYGIRDVAFDKDDTVIICALPDKHEGMIDELKECGAGRAVLLKGDLIGRMERYCLNHKRQERSYAHSEKCDILFFSQDNNATSGAFISMACLCDEIQRQSGKRILVVLPVCGDGEQLLEQKNVEYTYLHPESGWIKRAEDKYDGTSSINEDEINVLCDFIHGTGAALVHMNGSFVYAAGVAAMRAGIPVVWHLRENIISSGFAFRDEREAYRILNSSDGVICVSQYVYRAYNGLDPQKVHIIYNGADDEVFYKKRQIFGYPAVRVVMVGHITRLKGQDTLVRALDILKGNNEDVPHVTFVGSSQYDYIEELKEFINSKGLNEYVTFAGMTDTPEKYYHDADIAVSATVGGEGFDRVRIESMLSGCLLLANDAGAAREIVDDGRTGYLYASGDAESLAGAIKKAVGNKALSMEIASKAQDMCLGRYTKKCNAAQVVRLYNKILDKGKDSF